ncbi:diguanylate cyclase [uncultured Devosia sp.]|uniref:sensor domain-containing diguanylate cyclase n=1 Tax=uncultured Devosia sp. TaxID=211434 RepID=UPI0035CB95C4
MSQYSGSEAQRLAVLNQYELLDTAAEESFDRISRIVAAALQVPIAAVTLVDEHRQWFKSRIGLSVSETPRSASFCAHTMLGSEAFVVPDATLDQRFCNNPLVTGDPNIRFYAGFPIVTPQGVPVGAVCAIDTTPRTADLRELGLMKDLAALVVEQMTLRMSASLDGLTGALRRKTFEGMASREIKLAARANAPLGCLMLDADHFKAINDRFGHDVGDRVLRALVHTVKAGLRSTDLLGRLGGEEFGVLLPGTTRAASIEVAERLCQAISALDIQVVGERVPVTVSIGISERIAGDDSIMPLLHRADEALLAAKAEGRNRVVYGSAFGLLAAG